MVTYCNVTRTQNVNFPPCSKPFNGKIALAYEMTKRKQTKGVLNFIKKYLYNSLNYKFDDGTTQAINVPYPDSGVYENYILHYPDATSAEMLDINIDQLYSEVMVLTDAKIERAYEYILEERDPGNSTTNVLITIGVDDEAVFDGSATNYLHQLQNKYGFRSLVVSIGPQENYLGKLAESEDWYFTATEANSQWVADQISRIICHFNDDNAGLSAAYLYKLRDEGYKVISVSVGANHGDLSSIADKPEWYFQVDDSNGQQAADQISYIICNL